MTSVKCLRLSRPSAWLGAISALALVLSACGGGDTDDGQSATAANAGTSAASSNSGTSSGAPAPSTPGSTATPDSSSDPGADSDAAGNDSTGGSDSDGAAIEALEIAERIGFEGLPGKKHSVQELDGKLWLVTDKVAVPLDGAAGTISCDTAACVVPKGSAGSFTLPMVAADGKFFSREPSSRLLQWFDNSTAAGEANALMEVERKRPFMAGNSTQPIPFHDRLLIYSASHGQLHSFDPASVAVDTTPTAHEPLDISVTGGINISRIVGEDQLWIVDERNFAARPVLFEGGPYGELLSLEQAGWDTSNEAYAYADGNLVVVGFIDGDLTAFVLETSGTIREYPLDVDAIMHWNLPQVAGSSVVFLWEQRDDVRRHVTIFDPATGEYSNVDLGGPEGFMFSPVHADATSAWYFSSNEEPLLARVDVATGSVTHYNLPDVLVGTPSPKWVGETPYMITDDDDGNGEVIFLQ